MTRLTDTQRTLLAAAARREERNLPPAPEAPAEPPPQPPTEPHRQSGQNGHQRNHHRGRSEILHHYHDLSLFS